MNNDIKFIYNAIDEQRLLYARELTIRHWNFVINSLRRQTNETTHYLETFHKFMFGDSASLTPFIEDMSMYSSFYEYIHNQFVSKRFADITYINKNLMSYTPINGTIPIRDSNGRINISSPQERYHAATKGYVDDEVDVLGKIKNIQGIFTEEQITLMWGALEDGRYTLNSSDYGTELILVNKNTNDYSRITPSGKVFAYDFEEDKWKQVSGGGTGSGDSALVTLTSISPYTINTAVGSKTFIELEWSSEIHGNGLVYIYINKELKQTSPYPQGKISVDISKFVTAEDTYAFKLVVEDANGNKRSAIYTVNVVSLNISATFNNYDNFINNKHIIGTGNITLIYTVSGQDLTKKVFLQIDNNSPTLLGTYVEPEQTGEYIINELTHGLHTIKLWSSTDIDSNDEDDLVSEVIEYNLLYYVHGDATPILSTTFKNTTIEDGQLLIIDYVAYTNGADYTTVTRTVNNTSETSQDTPKLISWTIPYIVGTNNISLSAGSAVLNFTVTVNTSSIPLAPASNPVLFLSSSLKNNQINKNIWEYRDINTTFTNFLWGERDGWLKDKDNVTALHLSGDARAVINYQPLTNIPSAGKTIEIEFATKNVIDYTEKIIDIKGSNKRGITVYPNQFMLETKNYNNSNASIDDDDTEEDIAAKQNIEAINTKFKEDEHIRISIVITPKEETPTYNGKPLIYTYVNGVISGITPYNKGTESFTQDDPVSITIGSSYCDVLLYKIRVYDRMLSYNEVLNNYMYDTDNYEYKNELINKNFKLVSSNMSYSEMNKLLPIVTITADKLPAKEVDLFTCSVRIHYPGVSGKDKTYTNVKIKVQGTSSLNYVYKNFDLDFSESPEIGEGIQLYEGAIPETKLTIKADYASSAGVYNAGNAKIVNELYQEENPRQEDDTRVRNTIYGTPIAVYYRSNNYANPTFYYKGSLNLSKLSNALGYQEGDESWSTEDNISPLCLFRSNTFGDEEDPEKNLKIAFKSRYPKNAPFVNLKNLINWIYSCCTIGTKPEDDVLDLEKFKNEAPSWFNLHYLKMYYIYFMVMGGIDSMAKNMYLTYFAKDGKWYPQFYDMDSAFGINNQGKLKFNYNIEPGDKLGTSYIFNGSASILWKLVAGAYANEIKTLYQELRSNGVLTYEKMLQVLYDDGIKLYPEAVYNKDAYIKYVSVYNDTNENRLWAALGSTLEHLKFWIKNRLYYLDSLWQAGDYPEDRITCRTATPPENISEVDYTIDLTTYRDMYAYILYGTRKNGDVDNTYSTIKKAYKTIPFTMTPPSGVTFNDTEVDIYGASSLINIGDLSKWYCVEINLASAIKLSTIKIGDASPYNNPNLTEFTIGHNKMLRSVDIRNCSGLSSSIDASNCPNLEEFLAEGTNLNSVSFADGGALKVVHLPDTITSLILQNQNKITDLQFVGSDGYNNIDQLNIEYSNVPNLFEMVNDLVTSGTLKRLRLVGINWTIDDLSILDEIIENVKGLKSNGDNQDKSVLLGKITINTQIEAGKLQEYRDYWGSGLIFEVDNSNVLPIYLCKFYNYNKKIVEKQYVNSGEYATLPTNPDLIVKPQNDSKEVYYVFKSWVPDVSTTRVTENIIFTPEFEEHNLLIVQWKNYDGATIKIDKVINGAIVSYPLDDPKPYRGPDQQILKYEFAKWTDQNGNEKALYDQITVTSNLILTAHFIGVQKQQYVVKWFNKSDSTLKESNWILKEEVLEYGTDAEDTESTPIHDENYRFIGWGRDESNLTEDFIIKGPTNFYALFDEPNVFKVQITNTVSKPSIEVRRDKASEAYGLIIDWGDGTQDPYILDTPSSSGMFVCTKSSPYNAIGEYTITMPASDQYTFYSSYSHSGTDEWQVPNRGCFVNMKVIEATFVKTKINSNSEGLFVRQTNLRKVHLKNSTTIIHSHMFYGCSSLEEFDFTGIYEVGSNAFANTALKEINLTESCTILRSSAFRNTPITSFIIPKNLQQSSGAFYGCALNYITIHPENTHYHFEENILYSTNCLEYCLNKSTIDNIIVPEGVTSISLGVFKDSTLKSITIPKSCSSFSKYAFSGCTNLESVYYNGTISDWAAIYCSFFTSSSDTYASSLDISANPLMYASKLYLLQETGVYTEVPSNIEITNNNIEKTSIRLYATCAYLPVTHIFITGNSLTYPSTAALSNCPNLLEVTFNITNHQYSYLDDLTFSSNPKLEEINFGIDSIRQFTYDYYFTECPNLKLLDFSQYTLIPSLGSRALSKLPSTCIIKVPDSLYETWKETSGWVTYRAQIKPESEVSE